MAYRAENYDQRLALEGANRILFAERLKQNVAFYKRGLYSPAEFFRTLTNTPEVFETRVGINQEWSAKQDQSTEHLTVKAGRGELEITNYKGTYVGEDDETAKLEVDSSGNLATKEVIETSVYGQRGYFQLKTWPIAGDKDPIGDKLLNAFLNINKSKN